MVGLWILTVNAEGHTVMGRMHRPTEEKLAAVILGPKTMTSGCIR